MTEARKPLGLIGHIVNVVENHGLQSDDAERAWRESPRLQAQWSVIAKAIADEAVRRHYEDTTGHIQLTEVTKPKPPVDIMSITRDICG